MKIDVTPLKEARNENTHKCELLIASLRSQIADAATQYITDLSNIVPANAEKVEIVLGIISIDNGALCLTVYSKFFGKKILFPCQTPPCDVFLCSLEGDAVLVRHNNEKENFDLTCIEFLDKPVDISSNNLSLYYKDKFGIIPLTELWEEDIPSSFTIDLV